MIYAQIVPTIRQNPKIRRLAKAAFEGDRAKAIGAWVCVLLLAAEHAEDGDLSNFDLELLAEDCFVTECQISTMVEVGLLAAVEGGGLSIPGWAEHTGRGLSKRAKWRRQKQEQRNRPAEDVRAEKGGQSARTSTPPLVDRSTPDRTGQDRTGQDRTKISPREILEGHADEWPKARWLETSFLAVFCEAHRLAFGATRAKLPTAQDTKHLRALLRDEGRVPSEVAKAIVGFARDPWEGRAKHNRWEYLRRDFDKFLGWYDAKPAPEPKAKTSGGFRRRGKEAPAEDTHGTAIELPPGYAWDERDEDCLAKGWNWSGTGWLSEKPRRTR